LFSAHEGPPKSGVVSKKRKGEQIKRIFFCSEEIGGAKVGRGKKDRTREKLIKTRNATCSTVKAKKKILAPNAKTFNSGSPTAGIHGRKTSGKKIFIHMMG